MDKPITEQGTSQRRGYLATIAALLMLVLAVGAALASHTGGITGGVEKLSFALSGSLNGVTSSIPLRFYAFGAGMLAAFNPCGFALLPAYLGFYLGDDSRAPSGPIGWTVSVVRAAWIGLVVTCGFVVLFGVVTGVLGAVGSEMSRLFPLIGLIVGLVLIIMAGRMLSGQPFYLGLAEHVASNLGSSARRTNTAGYLLYGLAYGAASLGCTLPIFLTVVGSSLGAGNLGSAAYQFVMYALGMGLVIAILTVSIAIVKDALVVRVRCILRFIEPISAVLLLLAGGYVVYYWLTQGGILASIR